MTTVECTDKSCNLGVLVQQLKEGRFHDVILIIDAKDGQVGLIGCCGESEGRYASVGVSISEHL